MLTNRVYFNGKTVEHLCFGYNLLILVVLKLYFRQNLMHNYSGYYANSLKFRN